MYNIRKIIPYLVMSTMAATISTSVHARDVTDPVAGLTSEEIRQIFSEHSWLPGNREKYVFPSDGSIGIVHRPAPHADINHDIENLPDNPPASVDSRLPPVIAKVKLPIISGPDSVPEPELPIVTVSPPHADPIIPEISGPDPANPATWRTDEFNRQYGLGLIGVEHRYAAGATGQGTLGAIFDTGIDIEHDDVDMSRIRRDLSYNFDRRYPDSIKDFHGHGTGVFGIAGASRNGTGIHGVAPDAEFMILKNGYTYNDIHDAFRRVTAAKADAMNNSWGWDLRTADSKYTPEQLLEKFGPEFRETMRELVFARVSVIFATGNNSSDEAQNMARLPAAMPFLENNWIAVTALNDTRDFTSSAMDKAVFANACGSAMNWCMAAPGSNITTLDTTLTPQDREYQTPSGTSLAAPHVMGAVLVLKSQFPELHAWQVHDILFETAVDLGAPGVDPVFGHGALNLGAAISPIGEVKVELGRKVAEIIAPLVDSIVHEEPVTGGVFEAALSDRYVLVTDNYNRAYFADLGPRISTGSFSLSPDLQAGLSAAFSSGRISRSDTAKTGFDLHFDAFGTEHDVTRIAHADPVMGMISSSRTTGFSTGTGFSMQIPVGKSTVSMTHAVTGSGNALSLGAGLPFGDGHVIRASLGRAQEVDSILGTELQGAFAGLNSETFYGRVQADIVLGEKVTLNGSVTTGQTSFHGNGLITDGRVNTRAMALGLTFSDALVRGDKLSVALARPFAVRGGRMTLRNGTGISAAVNGVRTDRVSLVENDISLGAARRAPELHLGYLHGFDLKGWDSADLAFGGIARLDGGVKAAAARVALNLRF